MSFLLSTSLMNYKPDTTSGWQPIAVSINTAELIDYLYPVGSIYMSVNSTSPASLFGGTWEQIQDTFLLAAGSTYTAGSTGGSATINLQHYHTTSGHTLTTSEIPSHSHKESSNTVVYKSGGRIGDLWQVTGSEFDTNDQKNEYTATAGDGGSHSHGNTGNSLSTSQNIMPLYLTVYVWKRTA